MRIIGIDQGPLSGGMVLLDAATGEIIDREKFDGQTDDDIREILAEWATTNPPNLVVAYVEKVQTRANQSVISTRTSCEHAGVVTGILVGLKIPREFVSAAKWQKALGCLTGGDKRITKAAAQRRWPNLKWTHAVADAALIAEYGRIYGRYPSIVLGTS